MAKKITIRKKNSFKTRRSTPKTNSASIGSGISILLFGVAFGYFLSKSRASDFDTVLNMFLFTDFQLYGVMAAALTVIALGLFLLRRNDKNFAKQTDAWENPPLDRKRLIGAFIFGAGWALAGICPGTVFTQLGEGKLSAFFPLIGLFAGVWAFLRFGPKFKK
jgi:uncharacterized membrane protein YedE/YeeE